MSKIELKDAQSDAISQRRAIEEEFTPEWRDFFELEFAREQQEIMNLLRETLGVKQVQNREFQELKKGFANLVERFQTRMRNEVDQEVLIRQLDKTIESVRDEVGEFSLSQSTTQLAADITNEFTEKLNKVTERRLRLELTKAQAEGVSIDELTRRIEDRISGWDQFRSRMVARTESNRVANRAAVESYKAANITKKQWLASGDACVYCADLNGSIVEVTADFVGDGESFQPEGAGTPLNLGMGSVGHPPAHPHCRCTVVAVL